MKLLSMAFNFLFAGFKLVAAIITVAVILLPFTAGYLTSVVLSGWRVGRESFDNFIKKMKADVEERKNADTD